MVGQSTYQRIFELKYAENCIDDRKQLIRPIERSVSFAAELATVDHILTVNTMTTECG